MNRSCTFDTVQNFHVVELGQVSNVKSIVQTRSYLYTRQLKIPFCRIGYSVSRDEGVFRCIVVEGPKTLGEKEGEKYFLLNLFPSIIPFEVGNIDGHQIFYVDHG